MTDKATMLDEAGLAFTELREAIDGLTDEEMRRVWLHISGWHDEMAAALDRVAKGDALYPAGTYDDFDAWNARFIDQRAGMKTAEVRTAVDVSHRRLIGAAGHYREHAAQIRQWRRT
ncbi:MAG: hypothetical protein ACREKG_12690 [Candidatus Rokuibacteriota bacterium]